MYILPVDKNAGGTEEGYFGRLSWCTVYISLKGDRPTDISYVTTRKKSSPRCPFRFTIVLCLVRLEPVSRAIEGHHRTTSEVAGRWPKHTYPILLTVCGGHVRTEVVLCERARACACVCSACSAELEDGGNHHRLGSTDSRIREGTGKKK